jgi:hypothetical protein
VLAHSGIFLCPERANHRFSSYFLIMERISFIFVIGFRQGVGSFTFVRVAWGFILP